MLQILEGDEVVFAMHDDGKIVVHTDSAKLASSMKAARRAVDYLNTCIRASWIPSPEHASQAGPVTPVCHADTSFERLEKLHADWKELCSALETVSRLKGLIVR